MRECKPVIFHWARRQLFKLKCFASLLPHSHKQFWAQNKNKHSLYSRSARPIRKYTNVGRRKFTLFMISIIFWMHQNDLNIAKRWTGLSSASIHLLISFHLNYKQFCFIWHIISNLKICFFFNSLQLTKNMNQMLSKKKSFSAQMFNNLWVFW